MPKTDTKVMPSLVEMITGLIYEIGEGTQQYAGISIGNIVMQGGDEVLVAADPVKAALWGKEAIDRLDILTDKKAREKIMTACGRTCQSMNKKARNN